MYANAQQLRWNTDTTGYKGVGETRLEINTGLVECLSLVALDRDLRGDESALKQSKDMDQMLITRHDTRILIATCVTQTTAHTLRPSPSAR